jgi:hypothetical protein
LADILGLDSEQLANVPLLVAASLEEGRGAHLEAQYQCVQRRVQVALAGKKVQAEEPVVAPTLSNLKVGGKLSDNIFAVVARALMDHFYSILIPEIKNI